MGNSSRQMAQADYSAKSLRSVPSTMANSSSVGWETSLQEIEDKNYYSSSSSLDMLGLTREETVDLLRERVIAFAKTSNDYVGSAPTVTKSGKCIIITDGVRIEISIREDNTAVLISTVVFRVRHNEVLEGRKGNFNSYSLMTKMMKFNTMLNRIDAGQVGHYDGSFVYFLNLDLLDLSSSNAGNADQNHFNTRVADYISKAIEIRNELRACSQKRRKRRFLF